MTLTVGTFTDQILLFGAKILILFLFRLNKNKKDYLYIYLYLNMVVNSQKCVSCGVLKNFEFFYKQIGNTSGYNKTCKKCICKKLRDNYIPKEYKKKPKNLNCISQTKAYRRKNSLEFRRNNIVKQIIYGVKSSAKKRGLDFNLEDSDIVIPKRCPYLGFKMTTGVGNGKIYSNPSVDRINSELGYVKGNIQIISNMANTMKSNASVDLLMVFAKNIIKIHGKSK